MQNGTEIHGDPPFVRIRYGRRYPLTTLSGLMPLSEVDEFIARLNRCGFLGEVADQENARTEDLHARAVAQAG